jgi:threonylcarbamoyladenosine tRNA methylthiotransferase MtaB
MDRVRLSSIEPNELTQDIVDLVAKSQILCNHFHIPLQSGDDRILKKMHRDYTRSFFEDLIHRIQNRIPDAALGADILIGFPGETENAFENTYTLIEKLPVTYLHVFPFSPREGTEAFTLPDRIPADTVKQRLNTLLEISQAKSLFFRRQFLCRILPAITLSNEEEQGSSTVLTGNYIHAKVPAHSVPPNRLVNVCIEDVTRSGTFARIIGP